jgi:hypothetical protein
MLVARSSLQAVYFVQKTNVNYLFHSRPIRVSICPILNLKKIHLNYKIRRAKVIQLRAMGWRHTYAEEGA